MKNRLEIQVSDAVDPDSSMADNLMKIVKPLDAAEQLSVAKELRKVVSLIERSIYEDEVNPNLQSSQPDKKVPRGFFLVNLAEWRQNELRQLAKECGMELRLMIRWGILHVRSELVNKLKIARQLGIKPSECWQHIEANPRN